jgi:imidazolonepropionase-like amidohydrolase
MKSIFRMLAIGFVLQLGIAGAQTTALTGARVHTVGPDGTLEDATIIIQGGRITAVGAGVTIPADAERIDASGKIITPGLFTPIGQLGLSEVSYVPGTNDAVQRGDQFAAAFDVADAYNPRSVLIPVNRIDGVTRAAITPYAAAADEVGNSSRVLSGLGSIVQLGDVPEYFSKRGAVVVTNFGETGSNVAGGSRAAAVMILRAALNDASDYQQNRSAYERGDWREYSVSAADLDALQSVLDRSTPLLFNVNRASDISVVLGIAAEYGIRAIIAGGAEAWMVADQLAAADVAVILDGMNNLPGDFDHINARLDSANILLNAGVTVAFGAGARTHNARNLTQSAGIAVANGLEWDAALAAITLAPAQIYGVDDLVGSIEPGKEADLVIWSDDPLELTNYPEQVYIQGIAISMQSRQTLLRDRYLQAESDKSPAFRN